MDESLNVTGDNGTDVYFGAASTVRTPTSPTWYETGKVQIPLYAVIFMLAVVGNTLVILTLVSLIKLIQVIFMRDENCNAEPL